MRPRARLLAALPIAVLFAVSAVAGCASSVTGAGTGSLAPSSTSAASSTAPTTPSSTVATKTSSSVPASKSSATAPTSKTSTAPTGMAELSSLTFTNPSCGAGDTEKIFTLTWTSKNSNEVWIESGPVALALNGADPKTDSNGTNLTNPAGSNVASGNTQVAFQCANANYYYLVEFYNTATNTKSGQVQQVPSK